PRCLSLEGTKGDRAEARDCTGLWYQLSPEGNERSREPAILSFPRTLEARLAEVRREDRQVLAVHEVVVVEISGLAEAGVAAAGAEEEGEVDTMGAVHPAALIQIPLEEGRAGDGEAGDLAVHGVRSRQRQIARAEADAVDVAQRRRRLVGEAHPLRVAGRGYVHHRAVDQEAGVG